MLLLLLKRLLPWPHSTSVDFNEEQYEVARYVFLKVCMYLFTCLYTFVFMCIYYNVRACVRVCACTCTYVYVHVYCICMCVCVCMCLHIDVSFVNLPTLTFADSIFSCICFNLYHVRMMNQGIANTV